MKVYLGFSYIGINHRYHEDLWRAAVRALSWQEVGLEQADVGVMWGPNVELGRLQAQHKPVLVCDFPYWNRGWKVRDGKEYYKVSLNAQHPTRYVMTEEHGPERYTQTGGAPIHPWRKVGGPVLLAGMGWKAAKQFGHEPFEWERQTVKILRAHTEKKIIYRPKPGQAPVVHIPGTEFDDGKLPAEQVIARAHAVVCHHGNPTVTALQLGVPIFMNGPIGVASHLAEFELEKVNTPRYPEGREQFLHNLAHWQFSCDEIRSGKAFRSFIGRGFM